jgi:hypothetical protein
MLKGEGYAYGSELCLRERVMLKRERVMVKGACYA